MLIYTAVLNIQKTITKGGFMNLITEWRRSAENDRKGETDRNEGDEKSPEIVDLPEKDILAFRQKGDDAWCTEVVLNLSERKVSIRVKHYYGEETETNPALPFVSLLIRNRYLLNDQDLPVTQSPIMITDDDLDTIKAVLINPAYYSLPLVYVSRDFRDQLPVNISSLAASLSGTAHVLVERSKKDCKKCREICRVSPEEFGAVRIYAPGRERKRFLFRSSTGDVEERTENVMRYVTGYWNLQKLDPLYTWQGVKDVIIAHRLDDQAQELKEANEARQIAEAEMNEVYETFDGDITDLQKKLDYLTRESDNLRIENSCLRAKIGASGSVPVIVQGNEEDLYPDEIRDMLLEIMNNALNNVEKGSRRYDVLQDILQNNPYQHLIEKKKKELKKIFKNFRSMSESMKKDLMAMGFQITESGKHYKLTFNGDQRYMVSVSKTPSDANSGNNCASDIGKMMM